MAQATGTITFSSVPDQYTKITIGDGQGGAYSDLILGILSDSNSIPRTWYAGTSDSNNQVNGNASNIMAIYREGGSTGDTETKPYFYMHFQDSDGQTFSDWKDKWSSNNGSQPFALRIRDHSGNTIDIDFYAEDDETAFGSSDRLGTGTYTQLVRKNSSTSYSAMVPYQGSGYTYDYKFANTIKEILNDAKTNGALDIETSTVASSRYVQVQSTQRGHEGLGLSVTLVPYGSASWTSLDDAVVAVVDFTSTQNGYDHAHLQNKHETVYASFGEYTAESGISGDVMSTSQFATYVAAAINAAGIGITASASDSTVSLTNDNHGTEGNVTITATNTGSGSTNTTVSGMSGGSAQSGGGGGSGSMSKRLKISAAQIALSGSGGLSGSADNKSALVLDLAGLQASGTLVASDVFAIAGAAGGSTPKKVTLTNLGAKMAGDGLSAANGVLAVDFSEISAEAINVAEDTFLFVDEGASGDPTKKESIADLMTAVAGDALAASSGVLAVQANSTSFQIASDEVQLASGVAGAGLALGSHALSVNVDDSGIEINSDTLRLKDDGVTGAKLAPAVAGAALAQDGSGNLDVQVDDSSIEVDSDALQVKALGITNAMLAGSIVASKMNNAIFEDLETLGAASADGEFIVATGAGAFAYESGNTARTSLGLGTGDSPQFTSLVLSGDLTVQGSTVTMDVANLQVEDTIIGLGKSGSVEGAAGDRGLIMHIASETNPAMFWDESEDEFAFVRTNATGSDSAITPDAYADLHVNAMDVDGGFDVAGASVLNGTLQLAGVADAAADVSADSFYFLDGDSLVKSESMADYAASIAGDGLKAAAGVLAVDMNELTEAVVAPGSDSFMFIDSDGNVTRKDAIADLATLQAGAGLAASSGVFAVNVDDTGIEINSDSLRLKDLGVTTAKLAADAVTGAKVADDAIDSEHIADGAIDLAHMSANSVDSDQYVDGSIDRAHLAADVIDGTKIEDDAVDSEHIADGAIDLAHMSANSVDSDQYVDGSIDTAHLGDLQVTTAKLAADAVTGAKVADDAIDSEHIADGAIDLAHMSANSVDSDQYVDGSIDTAHLSADCVTADKLNDDVKGNGIQISGGVLSISQAQEVFASQSDGTTELTLSGTPASDEAVYVFMNGLLLAEGSGRDYTISSGVITLASANAMQTQDEVVVKFINQ